MNIKTIVAKGYWTDILVLFVIGIKKCLVTTHRFGPEDLAIIILSDGEDFMSNIGRNKISRIFLDAIIIYHGGCLILVAANHDDRRFDIGAQINIGDS